MQRLIQWGWCQYAMPHAETVGLFVWRSSFQTGAGAAGALTLG